MTKNVQANIIVTIALIIIFLYSLPFFFFSYYINAVPVLWGPPMPSVITSTVIVLFIAGLLVSGFSLSMFYLKKKGPLPKWLEFLIVLIAIAPPIFYLFNIIMF
jgi:hypothetical protein